MSIEAMNMAFAMDIKPSSLKFVLVVLGNYANENNLAYPSIPTLAKKTGQDDKTVRKNLQKLIDLGFITDTLHRVGKTKQVVVYHLNLNTPKNGTLPKTEGSQISHERLPKTEPLNTPKNGTQNRKVFNKKGIENISNKKIPEYFMLPDDWIVWAKEKRPELSTESVIDLFDAFKDHHLSKASIFADWKRAWQTWVRNDEKFHPVKNKPYCDDDIFKGCVNYG